MIHGLIALLALFFAFLYIEFSYLHGIAKTIGDMAYYGAIGIIVLALLFLSNQFLGSIPVIAPLTKIFRRLMAKFKIDREFKSSGPCFCSPDRSFYSSSCNTNS